MTFQLSASDSGASVGPLGAKSRFLQDAELGPGVCLQGCEGTAGNQLALNVWLCARSHLLAVEPNTQTSSSNPNPWVRDATAETRRVF